MFGGKRSVRDERRGLSIEEIARAMQKSNIERPMLPDGFAEKVSNIIKTSSKQTQEG
jgi:hypothetical protein